MTNGGKGAFASIGGTWLGILGMAALVTACGGAPDAAAGANDAVGAADRSATGDEAPSRGEPDAGSPSRATPQASCRSGPRLAFAAADAVDAAYARGDAVDDALAAIGATRASFGLSAEALATSKLDKNDPRMLEAARVSLRRPAALPAYGRAVSGALDAALGGDAPVTDAIVVASSMRDAAVTACVDGGWAATPRDDAAPLALALAELRGGARGSDAEVAGVPLELQRALVPILRAMAAADSEIAAARSGASADMLRAIAEVPSLMIGVRRFAWSKELYESFERVDTKRIASAAASVAYAVERADLARFRGAPLPPVELPTPLGAIVLRGAGNDAWQARSSDDDAPALLLDTGGDDVYRGAVAAATRTRAVSVLVDLAGADTYAYAEAPSASGDRGLPSDGAGRIEGRTRSRIGRQGSGVLGVGLLFDLGGGNDAYRSLLGSQGAGSHGVGVLYDDGGDDLYEAEGFSQGAAAWGIGLLLDRSGRDRHRVHHASQGFGFTRGVGALIDGAGDDEYVADRGDAAPDGATIYPSPVMPTANHSLSQGCGVGQRPDAPAPGYPLPGGIGVLRDRAGQDRYSAGVLGQGCGFVQGLGMLLEGGGDDTYDASYYAQAIGLHMGAALLLESGGDDRYGMGYAMQGPSLAFAHDLAVAVHVDAGGDDDYRASTLALGAAYANGAAIFADGGGRDRFDVDSPPGCFGAAFVTEVRAERLTLPTAAVFVKSGGSGSYVTHGRDLLRSATQWGPRVDATPFERGVGVDAPSGRAEL